MDHRQRVIRTVQFKQVDRLPFRHAYGLMPGVLEDWHAQGLPSSVRQEKDIYKHFGFPPRPGHLPLDVGIRPAFPERLLEENEDYRIAVDSLGRTTKLSKKCASLPLPMDFPVKDFDTWLEYRQRLQFSPGRIGAELEKVAAENLAAGCLNSFSATGFYWLPRNLMGDEGLCLAYYLQGDLVKDILETYCSLIEQVLAAAMERVRLDCVHFSEDMAYRNASMVGPGIFDEFIRPYYLRIARLVERHNVPIFSVDTDGCLEELAGWFQACGVNLIGPNEVQAGNDLRRYRKRFGGTLAFDGGLDKRVLTQGRQAIDEMLEGTIPFMKATGGGWIIALDHRVLKGTTLSDFLYFLERLKELADCK